jgi:hypothetical protein
MSAYHDFQTEFNDQECLVAGLQAVGYNPNVYEVAQQLEGYHGDKRQQTAEIIVPRSQVGCASNDLGFKKQVDGTFSAIISDFDRGRHNDAWMGKLKQQVNLVKSKKTFTVMGRRLASSTETVRNGKKGILLTYTK